MAKEYSVELTKRFLKDLKKIDKFSAKLILKWLDKNIEGSDNPRLRGKGLVGNKKGIWRYRVGDYRVLCKIDDNKLIVLALTAGHRKQIYEKE
ncbi:cytotoxic translational repressor of toxin-antitoxin stability system [Enterococcus florum]|uniref:Cytotoxic translational repressor of toxin-antitoxin stability system n=1 Tax=Enterococcus florum TaxID=2480627 RepID=A0A4P5P9B4_9ENTE|nr:type II toxin-antitoxin system RelE/ParE family toxin [Enterococcus florum]GCF94665.1 cytotoxic translational repressor of toxin-antitoxin stability system [Enterococcus florum]